MSAACTPEQRAREVEKAIWAAVDRGEIILENGVYQREEPDGCHACAVGSAARVLCGIKRGSSDPMRRGLRDMGVMTATESYIMEAGFEQSMEDKYLRRSWEQHRGTYLTNYERAEWTEESWDAFFSLGRRLRARQRPTP